VANTRGKAKTSSLGFLFRVFTRFQKTRKKRDFTHKKAEEFRRIIARTITRRRRRRRRRRHATLGKRSNRAKRFN
jgi:hypothetical protein